MYRRMGTREHERLINQASAMNVDAIQSANVVRVVGDQGYAALFADVQLNHTAHTQDLSRGAGAATSSDVRQLVPAEGAPPTSPAAPKRPRTGAPLARPTEAPTQLVQLQGAPKRNDSVVVPSTLWPAYTCRELGGSGWMATVVQIHKTTARVTFDHARTRDGRPYESELLPLSELRVVERTQDNVMTAQVLSSP